MKSEPEIINPVPIGVKERSFGIVPVA